MIKFNFSGSYYDIGCQLGNRIKKFFQIPNISKKTIEFGQECQVHVKRYTPGILDEIQGLCDVTNFNLEILSAFILALGKDMIDQTRKMIQQGIDFGCSAMAISGDYSFLESPIFARNYDWMESFRKYFTVVWSTPKEGLSNISFTDHIVGRYGGSNKSGLAMCMNGIPAYETEWVPGLRMNIITRWILDNFKTTKEAISFIEKVPHICGHIYLIADKGGNIARIETTKDDVIITESERGFMAITNHFETKSLKKHEYKNFSFPNTNSQERLIKIQNWYKKQDSKITIDAIKKLFSSHDDGICNHFKFGGEITSTIWSWIATLGTDEILISDGSPCAHPYQKKEF